MERKQPKCPVKLVSNSTQTQVIDPQANMSGDFIDNLDKTLKVLYGKKIK